jgi:hypothetical protein
MLETGTRQASLGTGRPTRMRAGASAEASIQIFRTDLRAGHQRNAGMLASPENTGGHHCSGWPWMGS